ncbi:hypothetical protein BLA23254_06892 [Burkholderia lata]|uniref:Uncharacterized protein n=1 Tax=Burkholderia lata (strain ATCC 17760 / DSM 23089 / LMG 22485 / NCIMB 9086 / R18194 / 383) TaxID=482957 RepID=A0A6P2RVU2_BURL3|nr:hypothetical protein [Burkholderia lata]VWC40000.1 hypothetical protein BLA23254_06892 [Burkholderia lata]
MNKRTVVRAARLYSIAVVALMDNGGAETAEEIAVVQAAADAARAKLDAMRLRLGDVRSIRDCIALAKGMEGQ